MDQWSLVSVGLRQTDYNKDKLFSQQKTSKPLR